MDIDGNSWFVPYAGRRCKIKQDTNDRYIVSDECVDDSDIQCIPNIPNYCDNEGRLISLMDQMLKSKQDFGNVAAILVDVNKIPISKIKEYVTELEKIGIKTMMNKAS